MIHVRCDLQSCRNTLVSGYQIFAVALLFGVQSFKGHTVNRCITRRPVEAVKIVSAVI